MARKNILPKNKTINISIMTQISKLSDTEPKIMCVLLKALMEKLVCKIKCKFQQRDVRQMEMLDIKHSVTEMKNAFDWFICRLNTNEERSN